MQIQSSNEQVKSQSQDSWDPKQDFNQNQNKSKYSLFQKISIEYDDRIIEKNLDVQYEKPILNSNLFPMQNQQQERQPNFQQTQQQETILNDKQKIGSNKMQNEEKSTKNKQQCNNSKENPNSQALYNVLQDDDNQNWIKKKWETKNQNAQRPLTCPQCFNQICYSYQTLNQKKKKLKVNQSDQINQTFKSTANEKSYSSKLVDNITVHEHKIIRNRFASQNMQKQFQTIKKNEDNNVQIEQKLQSFQNSLKNRFQDINIKILISCQQCGLQLGYWNVNDEIYVLFNVI